MNSNASGELKAYFTQQLVESTEALEHTHQATEQRWVIGVTEQTGYGDAEETYTDHQTAEEIGALLAQWIDAPAMRVYDIFPCHCQVCDPPLGARCTCGGTLVDSGACRETCASCGRVYDEIPF